VTSPIHLIILASVFFVSLHHVALLSAGCWIYAYHATKNVPVRYISTIGLLLSLNCQPFSE